MIDFNFLKREGFIIGKRIKSHGWGFLCKTKVSIYIDLVREFFKMLLLERLITSTIKRTEINLNEEILEQVLRVSTDGVLEHSPKDKIEKLNFCLDRDDEEELKRVEARDFNVKKRLLHYIVYKFFLPKSESFDLVIDKDIVVMYHILKEISINFLELIIVAPKAIVNKKKAPLPYGMALTFILKMFGIRLKEPCDLGHTDTYNDHSLHRMRFNKVNGCWTRVRGVRS